MRICFLTNNLRQDNGAGVLSLRLIQGVQNKLNCEVFVLTSTSSGYKDEISILFPSKFKLLKNFIRIRKILKQSDIIHSLDGYPYGAIAMFASLGLKKKIIITAIGSGAISPLYKYGYAWLLKYCYKNASKITAISRFTKNEILKEVSGLDIQIINPRVDFKKFNDTKNSKYPDLLRYSPYILSVGHLGVRKGYQHSIKSFKKVSDNFPDFKYVIIGKKYTEEHYRRLKKIVRDLKLDNKVFILTNIESFKELLSFYHQAELFCILSQNKNHNVEGFGLVFLEAAACGLPVVGSKGCGVEDAVIDGQNGILVNENDEEAFAQAIIKILSNEKLKIKMKKESIDFAKKFDWSKKINEYIDVYKSCSSN